MRRLPGHGCAAQVLLTLFSVLRAQTAPDVALPRPERLLSWSQQEKAAGFRSMEKISPVHVVRRGKTAFPLRHAEAELAVKYVHDGKSWDTPTFMKHNDVAGLLVAKDGRILVERYALGFNDESLWTSFSVAKSITSTLLGLAIADGYIQSVNDPVVRYLPALKGSAYDGVSLRQVLNMTSGVKWNEDYDDPESDVNRCHRATDKTLGSPLLTYLAKLPREAAPGEKWLYKTAETDLAGEIVIAATGKTLAQYLSEKIWSKFGMERDAFWVTRDDKELGGCCLSMALRDYARFAMFVMNGGTAEQSDKFLAAWRVLAFGTTAASRQVLSQRGDAGGYGFQWWVETDGPGTYSARGIFGQSVYLNPSERVIVVTLSAWPTPLDRNRRKAVIAYEQAAVRSARSAPEKQD